MIERRGSGKNNERLLSHTGRPPGTRPATATRKPTREARQANWEANSGIVLANIQFAEKILAGPCPNGLPSRAILNLMGHTPPIKASKAAMRNFLTTRGLLKETNLDGERFWSVTAAGAERAANIQPSISSLHVRQCRAGIT